jgi:putative ABC transport system permease protein
VIALVFGFVLFSLSGTAGSSGIIWLIPGFVALIAGIILVSPFFLALLARVGRKAPIAVRLALRDLSRYRARSGSALSAISVGVLIAVVICVVAVARYSNVYDYVGPNLASTELAVWSPNGQNGNVPGPNGPNVTTPATPATPATPSIQSQEAGVHAIASAVGATDIVELDNPASSVGLQNPSGSGRQWDGQIYVATPALLRAYGINPSSIPSDVDVLSSRPGLSGSGVQLTYGGESGKGGGQLVGPGAGGGGGPGPGNTNTCSSGGCIAHPVLLEESRLPTGTDAPNTLITESALRRLHLASQSSLDGWILQANTPITSAQILNAQAVAATNNLSVESKNDAPTSSEIVNGATIFAIALALCILAMSIGLIRSETASELRTLTATGASSRTRRNLTAVTAGGLAFLGALLGTVAAYVGLAGFFRSSALEGGLSDIIDHIPWSNLFLIVIAMPIVAAIVGWVLAGRDPTGLSTRPME